MTTLLAKASKHLKTCATLEREFVEMFVGAPSGQIACSQDVGPLGHHDRS